MKTPWVSTSASAVYQVTRLATNGHLLTECYGIASGTVFDPSSLPTGKTCTSGNHSFTSYKVRMQGSLIVDFLRSDGGSYYAQAMVTAATCEPPKIMNPSTGICEDDPCTPLIGSEVDVGWYSRVYGKIAGRNWCTSKGGGCASQLKAGSSFCGTVRGNAYDCVATYVVKGPACKLSDSSDDNWCKTATCDDMVEQPDPDTTDPETPTHKPTDPTSPIETPDSLPPIDHTVTQPEPVEPEPDVTEPDPTPDSNGDIVTSVTNLNRDVNKALNDLNIDINKTQANLNTELVKLNSNVRQNAEQVNQLRKENVEIYQSNKALIQNLNRDVTSAVLANTERIDSELERVGDKLDGIKEGIDSLSDVDTSGAGQGTCIDTDTCMGFYESDYPEGLSGLMSSQMNELKTQVLDDFLGMFGELDLSNAQRPSFAIPILDFGTFDFGDYINFDWVFGFVRFCMIFSTVMVSRRIIFGG